MDPVPLVPPGLAILFPWNGNVAQLLDQVTPLAGIVSGPGNQGTRNTAMNQGHAGTPGNNLGIPRTTKFGGSPDAR